jgi:signal transduction histidine kinase
MNVLPHLFTLVFISLLPALAIQAYNELDLRKAREAEVHENALRMAKFASGELDQIVDHAEGLLTALSKFPAVRSLDGETCSRYVAELNKALPRYTIIGAHDLAGRSFCAPVEPADANASDRPYFRRALETGEFSIGEYTIGRIARKPVLPLALRFVDSAERAAGVVYAALDLDWLASYFAQKPLDGSTTLTICDRDATVLVHIPDNASFAGQRLPETHRAYVHAMQSGTDEIVGTDGIVRIIGYVPVKGIPKGLYLAVALTKQEAFASIDRATARGVVLIASGLALGLLAAWIGGRRLVCYPLGKLSEAASRWAGGRFEVRAGLGGVGEIARLGDTFDAMAAALERRGAERDQAEADLRNVAARLEQESAARGEVAEQLSRLNETLEQRVASETEARLKAEEAFRQAQKMEAIGQMTGGVAHDFNNLLQVVIGNLETLQIRATEEKHAVPSDEILKLTDAALQGARRGASLTYGLLAFSRQQALVPQSIDANKLVAGISDLIQRTIGEAIRSETVLAGGLWRALADPNQLEAALLNLAVNARDAMPHGGKLTVETANCYLDEAYARSHDEVTPGQYVLISVTDSGEGMAREVLERAFDPFFTTKDVGQGTGLGLSQVYGFVKQSNGHVKIYSESGQGTTVKLYLPRYLGAESPTAAAVADEHHREPGNAVILVVEDDEDVRAYTAAMLRKFGYRILEARDGTEALEILDRRADIDLLFTDVGLPGGRNGRQLAEEAVRRSPDLKVLFTTGYARNAIVHSGRLEPGVDLLLKPYTQSDLANKIRQVLDS